MNNACSYIGTSGYSYPHWSNDLFYPKGLSQNKWLEFYCERFNTVELNVTFYRLPKKEAFKGWHKRTSRNFVFSVKGSRFITHVKRLSDVKQPLGLFFERVKGLREKAKVILWQFPPNFKKDEGRLANFITLLKKYKSYRCAFEFRHKSWFSKQIYELLSSHNLAIVSADYPDFCKEIRHTGSFCYIRRHGAAAQLYSGCYSKEQLKKDAKILKEQCRIGRDIFIYFNNDAHGWAVENALALKKIVEKK